MDVMPGVMDAMPRHQAERVSGAGIMIKGDYNREVSNTVFRVGDQGGLVVDTRRGPPCSDQGCIRENNHSVFANTAARRIATKNHGTPLAQTARIVCGLHSGSNLTQLRLRNPHALDFRPLPDSPLRGAGCLGMDDIGAMAYSDPAPWRAGCNFSAACAPGMW